MLPVTHRMHPALGSFPKIFDVVTVREAPRLSSVEQRPNPLVKWFKDLVKAHGVGKNH